MAFYGIEIKTFWILILIFMAFQFNFLTISKSSSLCSSKFLRQENSKVCSLCFARCKEKLFSSL
jgi:hypothetical protein